MSDKRRKSRKKLAKEAAPANPMAAPAPPHELPQHLVELAGKEERQGIPSHLAFVWELRQIAFEQLRDLNAREAATSYLAHFKVRLSKSIMERTSEEQIALQRKAAIELFVLNPPEKGETCPTDPTDLS